MDETDFLLPFMCLPPSNQNEWLNLSVFVDTYNSKYNTNYTFKSFPENDNRTSPEPEVLLYDGDAKMVIERKFFSFPPDHIRIHQLWHEFCDAFSQQVFSTFSDSLYILEIKSADMPANKKEIIKLANEIANAVIKHEYDIKNSEGIYSDDLIPWSFFKLSDIEREYSRIDSGVNIRVKTRSCFYNNKQLNDAIPIIKDQVFKLIQSSIPKFSNYDNCLKVLILEPHTEIINISFKILREAIQSISIPSTIDQIWLAVQIEIDEEKFIKDYYRVQNDF